MLIPQQFLTSKNFFFETVPDNFKNYDIKYVT